MPKLHKVTQADITTVKGLKALRPSEQPYYHKVNKGLSVGVYAPGTGTFSWRARVRHDGRYRVETLKNVSTYPEAVAAALEFVEKLHKGTAPSRTEKARASRGNLTVQQLIEEYISQDKMVVDKGDRYKEWHYTSSRLSKRYVYPYIGTRKIKSLEAEDIQSLQTTLRKEVTAETLNRGTVTLRAALNYALARGYIQSAFWKQVSLAEEAEPEDRVNTKEYFSPEDRAAFIQAAGDELTAIVKCMHLTGCRPSEARRLTVGDVYLDKRLKQPYVRIKTYKGNRVSGTSRKFPLTNGRLAYFQELVGDRSYKSEPLFLTEKGGEWSMANLNKRHNAVRNALGLDGFQTYCWRHAWITDMIQANVQPLTVAKLAGTSLQYIQNNYTFGDDSLAGQLPEM